jgi:hypothetical protein
MSLNFKADPCFLICGLDCFYTGNAKNYGSCPLDNILSSGYLANPCLCFWTTNFIQWLAVHWISGCPVDNLIQWITLSSILNNRAQIIIKITCTHFTFNLNIYGVMVYKATFNNISAISWRSVVLVKETFNRSTRKKNPTVLPQITDTLYIVSSTPRLRGIWTHNVIGDMHWLHR